MNNPKYQSNGTSKNPSANVHLIDYMSILMDSRFRIPGTQFKFGIDPLIGLVPGIGDIVSYGMSSALIVGMVRQGASVNIVLWMLWNLFIDTFIGSLPLIGDVFDAWFKANCRNYRIFSRYITEQKEPGPIWPMLLLVLVAILGMLVLFLYLLFFWLPGQVF